jgi:flagellar hook assembly protein FlgD
VQSQCCALVTPTRFLSRNPGVGAASVTWDGRDVRGRTVAPGTYFYRAVAASGAATGRLLIVR